MGAKKLKAEPGVVKRVLIYTNRKTDPAYFDASSEELEAGAYLSLFEMLDESWRCYESLKEEEKPYHKKPEGHPAGCMCEECKAFRREEEVIPGREKERLAHLELYKAAKKGDALAAKKLLTARKDYEYEEFRFGSVESRVASYPPREWGVTKPCGEVWIAENGVYKWGTHGRVSTRALREKRAEYGYNGPGEKGALERLVTGSVLHFDPKTKTVVDLGDEVWTFAPRGKTKEGKVWDDGEWMYWGLGSDSEFKKTGIPILEQGSMKPGKVIHMTYQVCGGCKRDMERFGSGE